MMGENDQMKLIRGRDIAALLDPRPVILVTCCDELGSPNILTVAWQTPLSHDPPLLGISIDHRRYSHTLISQTGEFVVNVVSQKFQQAISLCGNSSGATSDKFETAGLTALPAYHVRPPLIAGALAHLECTVTSQLRTGDHTFFVGRVLYAEALQQCFDQGWAQEFGDVLLCLERNQFASWSRNGNTTEE